MRTDVLAPADPTLVDRSGLSVTLYKTATPLEIIQGTATGIDLTAATQSLRQSFSEASLGLAVDELPTASIPRPNHLVQVRLGTVPVFTGVVESTSGLEQRGSSRTVTAVLRTRDALPLFREVRRASQVFMVATELAAMARAILLDMGMSEEEFSIPDGGMNLPHDQTQLADMTTWDMLETILQPTLREPWVDARGIIRAVSRDVRRPADLALPADAVRSITPGRARSPVTAVRVKWLDPELKASYQKYRCLQTETLTVGFWKRSYEVQIWWSDDRTLRADSVKFKKPQSVNDGDLLGMIGIVADKEEFTQTSPYGGKITVEMNWLEIPLAVTAFEAFIASMFIPDNVVVGGLGLSGGKTVPSFERIAATTAAAIGLSSSLFRAGTGVYEVWGQPYDYVHATNSTEAYDKNAPDWAMNHEDVESQLVPNEQAAQGLAVNELFYRARGAAPAKLTVADDLRLERGDVLALPDGRRFYVTDGSRDLTRGADPLLDLSGFFT